MTNPIESDQIVELARGAWSVAGQLENVPGLFKRIIREEMWRERQIKRLRGQVVAFDTFEAFLTTPPLEGMGESLDALKRVCRDDNEALDLIDVATRGEHGGDHRSEAFRAGNINVDNINVDPPRPTGTSAQRALRHLRDRRPDLHARVLAREMSPHAAMCEAGFRHRPTALETLMRAWSRASERERIAAADHMLADDAVREHVAEVLRDRG